MTNDIANDTTKSECYSRASRTSCDTPVDRTDPAKSDFEKFSGFVFRCRDVTTV